jgi:hypothetical protein
MIHDGTTDEDSGGNTERINFSWSGVGEGSFLETSRKAALEHLYATSTPSGTGHIEDDPEH